MCQYRILKFDCPCFDTTLPNPLCDIWVTSCDNPSPLEEPDFRLPVICICFNRQFYFPALKLLGYVCFDCCIKKNLGLSRRDFFVDVQEWLDNVDNHLGGNPWMQMMTMSLTDWLRFILHNIAPPWITWSADIEIIEGAQFVPGSVDIDEAEASVQGDSAEEEDDGMKSDLDEDDLNEWPNEDDGDDDRMGDDDEEMGEAIEDDDLDLSNLRIY